MKNQATSLDHLKQSSQLLNSLMSLQNKGASKASGVGDAVSKVGESITQKDDVSMGISGLLQGIGGGMNQAALEKQQAGNSSMESSLMALMRQNNEIAQRAQELESEKKAFGDLLPEVVGLTKVTNPAAQKEYMSNLVKKFGEATNKQYELASFDPQQPFTPVVKDVSSGQIMPVDLIAHTRQMGDEEGAKYMQGLLPDAINKSHQELEKQRAEIAKLQSDTQISREKLALDKEKFEAEKQKPSAVQVEIDKKAYQDIQTAKKELDLYKRAGKMLADTTKDKDAKKVKSTQTGHEGLIGNWQTAAEEIPGIGHFASKIRSGPQAAFESLAAESQGAKFKSAGYRNQSEFESIKTIDPKLSREANLAIVQENLAALQNVVSKEGEILQRLQNSGVSQSYPEQPVQAMSADQNQESNPPSSGIIKINGQEIDINRLTPEQKQKLGIN